MSTSTYLFGADMAFGDEIAARLGAVVSDGSGPSGDPAAHVLIINRAVAKSQARFDEISDPVFAAAIEDGLLSLFDIVQAAIPSLGEGGRIVVVASRAHLGAWGGAQLCAVGAALVGLCRTLSLELAEAGVTVNIVAPDFADAYADNLQGRQRVAEAVAWFASPASAGVSGEVMLLDAGRSLQMREARRR